MHFHEVRAALMDRRLDAVAKATGLHYNTVKSIRDNPDANPTRKVIEALSAYLSKGVTA